MRQSASAIEPLHNVTIWVVDQVSKHSTTLAGAGPDHYVKDMVTTRRIQGHRGKNSANTAATWRDCALLIMPQSEQVEIALCEFVPYYRREYSTVTRREFLAWRICERCMPLTMRVFLAIRTFCPHLLRTRSLAPSAKRSCWTERGSAKMSIPKRWRPDETQPATRGVRPFQKPFEHVSVTAFWAELLCVKMEHKRLLK